MPLNTSDLKKKVLITAADLFYRKGIHNVGVNEIAAKSEVAKMTLYKYFPSKDQLILEVMRYRSEEWQDWFRESINKREGTPIERLLAIFDVMEEWFSSPDFQKCPFSTTAAELASINHPALQFCIQPMTASYSFLLKLSKEASIDNSQEFTQHALLLIGGCIMTANLQGKSAGITALQSARKAASILYINGVKTKVK
ncbi:MAG: TetR/AcrR family transcriptional regulator [Hapalosiphonaceae cyanobacterium JJU2]|nr:MAG: TetR/AcrR family transcriptional regulator [Hapalosiphonaceae cyanobacterium JJU2]